MDRAAASTTPDYDDVLFCVRNGIGRIVLNRPKAINALNHEMIRQIDSRLASWAQDDEVRAVVLTGAGERGLCAGGDIRSIYDDGRTGSRASVGFWRDEYRLNARIAAYEKPYVAVMDGIVMGGGVGISAHGAVRIVTERTIMAMPEVGIGFIPDVGGTYLLSRAPGELGTHIALTAERFTAADAIVCGLADYYVPTDRLPALDDLEPDSVPDTVRALAEPAPTSEVQAQRPWIDECYAADTVEEILDRLEVHPDAGAQRAAEQIRAKSPTALKVTLRALRAARVFPTLVQALEQEYGISAAALDSADLVEGIRAQVIDKDRQPRWSPATLAEVSAAVVERYFAPPPEEPLGLDRRPNAQVLT